jgi:uncharacterized protein DUF3175
MSARNSAARGKKPTRAGKAPSRRRKAARPKRKVAARRGKPRRWSAGVTRRSDALDLERGVFKQRSAKRIAASLKRSAERSHRRKGSPYQSAMSMLTFYMNRAGRDLPASRKRVLQRAKSELRKAFGREG